MFNGYFVAALDAEFKRVYGYGRTPVITTQEGRDYAAFGRSYLMGPMRPSTSEQKPRS